MTSVLLLIVGVAVGGIAGFAAARAAGVRRERLLAGELEAAKKDLASAREALAFAQAELKARQELAKDKEQTDQDLKQAFEALAARALKESSAQFLELAQTRLSSSEKQVVSELEKRQEAIGLLIKPLHDNLNKLEDFTQRIEAKREKAYGEMSAQLERLGTAATALHTSSNALAVALKGSSQARGRWGEMALRNIAEMAGMSEHCDFVEQSADSSGNRPDMVVRLPGKGLIPIDAKVPFADYEKYCQETDPNRRNEHLKAHAANLRRQVKELASRNYSDSLDGKVDFTVMFVPSEPMLSAAFEQNPDLQEEAMRSRILIATPVTLVALLRTVAIYWRQEQMAENAEKVWMAATELYERIAKLQEHLAKAGKGIETAVKAYNQVVGAFAGRVVPSGRRLEEMGLAKGSAVRIEEIDQLDTAVRELPAGPPSSDEDA